MKRPSKELLVKLDEELVEELLEAARLTHPKEFILLLRGEERNSGGFLEIKVRDYLVPPLASLGKASAIFRLSLIPADPDIVGTVHSHPSGSKLPSREDLENFIGHFIAIVAYPYRDERDLVAYDARGREVRVEVEASP